VSTCACPDREALQASAWGGVATRRFRTQRQRKLRRRGMQRGGWRADLRRRVRQPKSAGDAASRSRAFSAGRPTGLAVGLVGAAAAALTVPVRTRQRNRCESALLGHAGGGSSVQRAARSAYRRPTRRSLRAWLSRGRTARHERAAERARRLRCHCSTARPDCTDEGEPASLRAVLVKSPNDGSARFVVVRSSAAVPNF
jgi:hypothetical protein